MYMIITICILETLLCDAILCVIFGINTNSAPTISAFLDPRHHYSAYSCICTMEVSFVFSEDMLSEFSMSHDNAGMKTFVHVLN